MTMALVSNVPIKDTTKAPNKKHFEVSKWDLPQLYSMCQRHASTSRLC